ncbi:hypothetical protein BGX24_002964 [Mortierella sp. AD032]|nr:hypothetical protein BGX24_002964 [Mortierella sp. AD032]
MSQLLYHHHHRHRRKYEDGDGTETEGVTGRTEELEVLPVPNGARFVRQCINLEKLTATIIPSQRGLLLEHQCLKKLAVDRVDPGIILDITEALRISLPNADEIGYIKGYGNWKGGVIAEVISACRSGWKTVDLLTLYNVAAEALVKH